MKLLPMEVPHLVAVEEARDVIEVVKRHSREYGTKFEPEQEEVFIKPS